MGSGQSGLFAGLMWKCGSLCHFGGEADKNATFTETDKASKQRWNLALLLKNRQVFL